MLNKKQTTPVMACTLTASEHKKRRIETRKQIFSSIDEYERTELSLILKFDDTKVDGSLLERFIEQEQQCCGFLNFDILQTEGSVSLIIDGPDGAQSTLRAFAAAAGCTE